MNNNGCHQYPFHGFNNNMINHMQRFREEPWLRLGILSQPPLQPTPGAYAASGPAQPLMRCQAAHHGYRPPGYHLEGAGRRPAHDHEAFSTGLGNVSPAPRQQAAGTAPPLQADSTPGILEGQGNFLSCLQATAGRLDAAHQMEIQRRRQLEENMAHASLLIRNLSSNICAGADPAAWNHARGAASTGGQVHGKIFARGDGDAAGGDRQRQPGLVDYMGVQEVRVALGDVKAMVGYSKGTLSDHLDVRAEANNAMNLDLTLGCSDAIDLTLSL